MPRKTKAFKRDIPESPETIYLTIDEITAKLFSGMLYAWVCGYNYANYGGSYYYEFYHLNQNIYLVDATNKRLMAKLRKVFPIIDAWQDNSLLENEPWEVFTPDACLCIYAHKDILNNMTPQQIKNGHVPMNDEAQDIICRLNRQGGVYVYGAILGDIIGSPYEFDKGEKTKVFTMFSPQARFTDDTVMTVAVAEALLDVGTDADHGTVCRAVIRSMQKWGRKYPRVGYGGRFREWLKERNPKPYGSFGNGSAMRVSAVGWLYNSLERTREVARWTAEVTHNHPEGIKGAESVASAIYLARTGETKADIKKYIEAEFGYNLSRTLDEIRPSYHMDVTCQGSVPEAIIAFLEGHDFEDTVRNAVSIGGDTDTIACIAGSIAEAYYGISVKLEVECLKRIPTEMRRVLPSFDKANQRQVMDDGRIIEAALMRYDSEDDTADPQEVITALSCHLQNGGYLQMPNGAIELMDNITKSGNYSKVPWLLAFTSEAKYLDWHLWPDEINWEPAWYEDYEKSDATWEKLGKLLSFIAKAENKNAAIVLNQTAFYITPQIARDLLATYKPTEEESPLWDKMLLLGYKKLEGTWDE